MVGDELGVSDEFQAGQDVWTPDEPTSEISPQHIWRDETTQGYKAPTAQQPSNEVRRAASVQSVSVRVCQGWMGRCMGNTDTCHFDTYTHRCAC